MHVANMQTGRSVPLCHSPEARVLQTAPIVHRREQRRRQGCEHTVRAAAEVATTPAQTVITEALIHSAETCLTQAAQPSGLIV